MADADRITRLLLEHYPGPRLELKFRTPVELLVALILSAQATDERVNRVTRELFKRYRKAEDFAAANRAELEQAIRPTGYYRNKAKAVMACCQALVKAHGGQVPRDAAVLEELPGVGRKTANMVVGNAFGTPAIAVDTHVKRVSQRLGLAAGKTPGRIEKELMAQVPRERWTAFTNALILHGRRICTARQPDCCHCPLRNPCEWPDKPDC